MVDVKHVSLSVIVSTLSIVFSFPRTWATVHPSFIKGTLSLSLYFHAPKSIRRDCAARRDCIFPCQRFVGLWLPNSLEADVAALDQLS